MKQFIIWMLAAAWIVGAAPSASAMIFCVPNGGNPDPECEGPDPPAHCGQYDPGYGGRLIMAIKETFARYEIAVRNLVPTKALK